MIELFNTVLFEPIFNLLMWLYQSVPPHELGVSIILVTLILKLVLFIPAWSSIKSQQQMQEIQPKLDALRKKYENNKEELSRQLLVFYRENKINPLSSCLPILIQFPILIALYQVFVVVSRAPDGLLEANQLAHLYGSLGEVFSTTRIDTLFLGFIELKNKNLILAAIAAGLQFWQTKMLLKRQPKPTTGKPNMAQAMSRQMLYTMPLITLVFGASVPAGLTLYWAISTLFQVGQQYLFIRRRGQLATTSDTQLQTTP